MRMADHKTLSSEKGTEGSLCFGPLMSQLAIFSAYEKPSEPFRSHCLLTLSLQENVTSFSILTKILISPEIISLGSRENKGTMPKGEITCDCRRCFNESWVEDSPRTQCEICNIKKISS